jgi:hypothetical protein
LSTSCDWNRDVEARPTAVAANATRELNAQCGILDREMNVDLRCLGKWHSQKIERSESDMEEGR